MLELFNIFFFFFSLSLSLVPWLSSPLLSSLFLFLSFYFSFSFSFSDHNTLSFSPSRLPHPPQTTNSFTRVYSPSSSPPPQPTPLTHSYSQSQSQTLYEMILEEQHHKSKLSVDRCRKPHLRISKILDEMQTRTMSFRDQSGMDGLGFDFRISLLMLQTVMVVRLLISPTRCREGEVVVEGILGTELICGSGLIR